MAQFARPSADTVRTAWTDEAGGTTDIYTGIDEVSAEDTEYIKTPTPPGANEFETLLTTVTDPLVSTGHIMRWRRRKQPASGSDDVTLTVRLMMGGTQITSQSDPTIPGSFTDTSYTLSGGEADAITDYSTLRLEFVASGG
jgi:hypothetical protein